MEIKQSALPELPLKDWKDTKNTLHLYLQIIGKIRLALCKPLNHWWHVPLYVSASGLTTRPVPYDSGNFEIEIDFLNHQLVIKNSNNIRKSFTLHEGLTVADFYKKIFSSLADLNIQPDIKPIPYKVFTTEPFETDRQHSSYDKEYIERFHKVLSFINPVFEEFRGRFYGKSTPVHLFWHSFDLALTRFSGRTAPAWEGIGAVDREAYSHEVISFGFWAGDDNIPDAAFYSYTFPEPSGITSEQLSPPAAYWGNNRGSSLALLMYDEVRKSENPREMILNFLESTYNAGAKLSKWDRERLDVL